MNESFDSGEILFFDMYKLNHKKNLQEQIRISRVFSSKVFKKRVETLLKKNNISNSKSKYAWSKAAFTSNSINQLQKINFNVSKAEFEKRIKWVHHENYPLYTLIHGKKFILKI